MRKAAGVIMLVFGIFTITVALLILLRSEYGAITARVLVTPAVSVLAVAAGIGVLRRRAFWWALLVAIAMVLVGAINWVGIWQDPFFQPHLDTATRLLMAVGSWAPWGVPGLLALIFLVKRKGEFRASPNA